MKPLEFLGLKRIVLDLVSSDKRETGYQILDHLFSKATTLQELDVIGELSLKTEYRDLYFKCAEMGYSIALTTQERYAARNNLIKAYTTMNYPDKALFYIEQQLSLTPNDFEMLCQKAANTSLLGDKESGEAMLLEILKKFPQEEKHIQALLSGKYLREGNLARGISVFIDTYKGKNKLFDQEFRMKRWNGVVYPGKTIYVDGEGGIGDEIINIRFFKNIEKLGMTPILYSYNNKFYRHKNELFARHGYKIQTEPYSMDRSQYWIPMMSLPATLGLTEEKLWTGTYLSPLRNEKNKLSGDKFKIGIKCSGNPYFAQDEYRKIPLDLMLQYLPKNADIYYIDTTDGHKGVINLADRITSWEDTLDFIDQMDCIVSSCTSLVHAAGAIGKTTFVAVPIAEYYIWTSSRRDNSTPWYGDNFHVMKQTELRDWHSPLSQIAEQVNNLLKRKKGYE
jgi:tetratricopeptide (TPR) repeat protein